jgi:pre-mRNA-splicing factor CDC5/CEF1
MVRVIIKGGVWKNTEDEILKAAIMKYGKNQWSRIASLLHRKSAKQCKARWYEWLDPRIKKTEWSREEDEKLLHLAKIMPTQWRTIAPIVGRTATQCLERYEQLLDEAQRRAEGLEEGEALREAKKLKPGEVDPTPETKPARPDPIDMDEDELEMLSEARARLANTQGKKAKRKAREKQLAEARRLASLQKRRELRAAGIYAGNGLYRMMKKGIIDYNLEIPFEKPVPAGFHDPVEDEYDKSAVTRQTEKRRDQIEAEERRKDKKKITKRRADDNPESIFAQKQEHKRSKLVLPEPQVSDKELEDIVKIGQTSDSIRELIDENPTSTLLHDYSDSFRNAQAARTLRTPAALSDAISKAADDLLALTNTETPLKGGENAPLHSTDFTAPSGIRAAIQTPNTVLAAIGQTPRTNYEQTPGTVVSATPGATPFRDQLNINKEAERASVEELRQQLKTLPAPKNDFEVVMPEDEVKSDEEDVDMEWIEDAGELDSKRAALLEKKKQKELALRSEVFRRDLPKPSKLNDSFFKRYPVKNEYDEADNLIRAEMRNILRYDVNGTVPNDNFTFEELRDASILIDSEARKRGEFDEDEYMERAIAQTSGRRVFYNGRFVTVDEIPRKERSKAIAADFEKLVSLGKQIKSKTEKVQNKLKVILQGYEKIQDAAINTIQTSQHDVHIGGMEVVTFKALKEYEVNSANLRIQDLTKEVNALKEDEAALQKEYSDIMHQQWEINQHMLRKQATTEAEAMKYSNGNPPAENQH